jgi:hypothetical protein
MKKAPEKGAYNLGTEIDVLLSGVDHANGTIIN